MSQSVDAQLPMPDRCLALGDVVSHRARSGYERRVKIERYAAAGGEQIVVVEYDDSLNLNGLAARAGDNAQTWIVLYPQPSEHRLLMLRGGAQCPVAHAEASEFVGRLTDARRRLRVGN
jgi:hypothetical protein